MIEKMKKMEVGDKRKSVSRLPSRCCSSYAAGYTFGTDFLTFKCIDHLSNANKLWENYTELTLINVNCISFKTISYSFVSWGFAFIWGFAAPCLAGAPRWWLLFTAKVFRDKETTARYSQHDEDEDVVQEMGEKEVVLQPDERRC